MSSKRGGRQRDRRRRGRYGGENKTLTKWYIVLHNELCATFVQAEAVHDRRYNATGRGGIFIQAAVGVYGACLACLDCLHRSVRESFLVSYPLEEIVSRNGYLSNAAVESNLQAGSKFGYALIWVLFWATIAGLILQTLSSKLGIVSGMCFQILSLSQDEISRKRVLTSTPSRFEWCSGFALNWLSLQLISLKWLGQRLQ